MDHPTDPLAALWIEHLRAEHCPQTPSAADARAADAAIDLARFVRDL